MWRAALFLWKRPLSATESIIGWAVLKSSAALALSPAATAFWTFLTAVRNLERSDVLAALSLTSWRARLRPDARRTVFFLALERLPWMRDPWSCVDDAAKPSSIAAGRSRCCDRPDDACADPRGLAPPLSMNLLRAASTVSLLTLASRITGLVRDVADRRRCSAPARSTDAFNVAFRIPNLLRRLFGEGAFSQAFVPLLARTRAADGDEATQRLVDAVATVLIWALRRDLRRRRRRRAADGLGDGLGPGRASTPPWS